MAMLTEYDKRQIGKMAERLDLFAIRQVSLAVLISDLQFLIDALEAIEPEIQQVLKEKWEVLEEVYSVSVVMDDGKLSTQGESLIQEAVIALRRQIAELVGELTSGE